MDGWMDGCWMLDNYGSRMGNSYVGDRHIFGGKTARGADVQSCKLVV